MKLERVIPVKLTAEVWEYPAGVFRYTVALRGFNLAVEDGFRSKAEAEAAALAQLNTYTESLGEK